MSTPIPAEQFAKLPKPAEFECIEPKFKHEGAVFRAGNTYQLEDFPHISKDELHMFWRAGFVKVPGWPETPPRNPAATVLLNPHNVKHTVGVKDHG